MSKAKLKTVTMELPAGLLGWMEREARWRGMTVGELVQDLARMERDGGAVLDVDVIRGEDGTVRMEVFPDEGRGEGIDEAEALAALRESVATRRRDVLNWRINRAMKGKAGHRRGGKRIEYPARVEFDRVRINGLPGQLGKWAEQSRKGRAEKR